MWTFLKRYFGWYLWLGLYTTVLGALVGVAFFVFPWAPVIIMFFGGVAMVALAFSAPLNLVVLPIAFHILRDRPGRAAALRMVGAVGGFLSIPPVAAVLGLVRDSGPWQPWILPGWDAFAAALPMLLTFSLIGAVAGMVCAKRFYRHGDAGSLFDINAALDYVRAQPGP